MEIAPGNECISSIGIYLAVPLPSDVDVTNNFSILSLAACNTFKVPFIFVSTELSGE